MECSEKHGWNDESWSRKIRDDKARHRLFSIHIDAPKKEIRDAVLDNWDHVAKPLDSLGRFELLTAQIGAVTGTTRVEIKKKAVLMMCVDNGIVSEGVSQSGQEVTLAVAKEMARGCSSVGKMAAAIGADTIPVDIGINQEETVPGLKQKKVRCGTRNFRKEPAMTEAEAIEAIFVGIDLVRECKEAGYQLLGTGEMGIGNTTTSSAVTAALLHCSAAEVTGRGAGLSDDSLARKRAVIEEAILRYQLYEADPLTILSCVGGLDIAGLAGVCIGGGMYHLPVVLDGVISMAAALLAERLIPGTAEYLIPSHRGKEPAAGKLAAALGLQPVIEAELALGEGTGAVMMMSLLDLALRLYQEKLTFSDLKIEQYERYIRR